MNIVWGLETMLRSTLMSKTRTMYAVYFNLYMQNCVIEKVVFRRSGIKWSMLTADSFIIGD